MTKEKILKEIKQLADKMNEAEDRYMKNIFGEQGGRGTIPSIIPIANTELWHIYYDLCEYWGIEKNF